MSAAGNAIVLEIVYRDGRRGMTISGPRDEAVLLAVNARIEVA